VLRLCGRKPWEKADKVVRLTGQARLWGSSKHGLQAPNGGLSLLHNQIPNLNSSIRPFQFDYSLDSFVLFTTMNRNVVFKLSRTATRYLSTPSSTITRSSLLRQSRLSILSQRTRYTPVQVYRSFSITPVTPKGLSPESEDPQPKQAESSTTGAVPADITVAEYNALSDAYIDALVERLEQLQEERDDVDVEYSVTHPSSFPPYLCNPFQSSIMKLTRVT